MVRHHFSGARYSSQLTSKIGFISCCLATETDKQEVRLVSRISFCCILGRYDELAMARQTTFCICSPAWYHHTPTHPLSWAWSINCCYLLCLPDWVSGLYAWWPWLSGFCLAARQDKIRKAWVWGHMHDAAVHGYFNTGVYNTVQTTCSPRAPYVGSVSLAVPGWEQWHHWAPVPGSCSAPFPIAPYQEHPSNAAQIPLIQICLQWRHWGRHMNTLHAWASCERCGFSCWSLRSEISSSLN